MSMLTGVSELQVSDGIESIETSHDAIKREFKKYTIEKAFIEAIWNSLDSNSKNISISLELKNEIGNIARIIIQDDGDGINYDEIPNTFKKFKESPKHNNKGPMVKGEKGLGRFAFHRFAHHATWISKTQTGACKIEMNSDNLNEFKREVLSKSDSPSFNKGTRLTYDHIDESLNKIIFEERIIPFLSKELSCHLLVNTSTHIEINGVEINPIQYSLVNKTHDVKGHQFSCRYVQWEENPKNKSYIYFIGKNSKSVIHKELTKTNHKNNFYISAYIESDFFDNFEVTNGILNLDDKFNLDTEEYREILKISRDEISDIFFEFRRREAERLIQEYEDNGIFPDYAKNGDAPFLAECKRNALKETIRVLYQAEPTLFNQIKGNKKHVKVFIKLLDRITLNPSDDLFDILDGVVNLSKKDEHDLAEILRETSLTNITKAISEIKKRQEVITILKSILSEHNKDSKEKHIQKIIENNLWIFGEQYHLLTAEEPKFEEALLKLLEIEGNDSYYQKGMITHSSKNKEMDIFCVRRSKDVDVDGREFYRCLVVELKRSSENLKDKHFNQLQEYFSVIETTPEFSDGNHVWDFILVGKDMGQKTSTSSIRALINKSGHDQGLLMQSESGDHKLYCRTWSNIFSSYEIKHKHLLDNLSLQAKNLTQKTPDELSDRAASLGIEIANN